MADETIKPCPHCGGVAYLNSNYSYRRRTFFVFVKCDICGSQGKIYNSQDEPNEVDWNNRSCIDAVTAWNMRTTEQTNHAELMEG